MVEGGTRSRTKRWKRPVLVGAALALTTALALSVVQAPAQTATCLGHTPTLAGTDASDVLNGTPDADFIDGRGGNDLLQGLGGDDGLCGGTGDDDLNGVDGRDILHGGPGADTFFGGAGNADQAFYLDRTAAVRVTLDGVADDGAPGDRFGRGAERDNVGTSVEVVSTGSGNDTLVGSGADNNLLASGGADRIDGGLGVDTLLGKGGPDFLDANDGVRDNIVDCGPAGDPGDEARLDLKDDGDPSTGAGRIPVFNCETITVGAVNEGPNVRISGRTASLTRVRRARIRLSCPSALTTPCAGRLTLRSARRRGTLGSRRYRIRDGRRKVVPVPISRSGAALIRRRGTLRVVATARERGRFGPKTTVRVLRIKRR